MLTKLKSNYYAVYGRSFGDYVTFPLYQRMLHLWRVLSYQSDNFINSHLIDATITNMGKKEDWIDLQCETCQWEISDRLQMFVENIYIPNHPEWETLNDLDFTQENLWKIAEQYQPAYQLNLL